MRGTAEEEEERVGLNAENDRVESITGVDESGLYDTRDGNFRRPLAEVSSSPKRSTSQKMASQ